MAEGDTPESEEMFRTDSPDVAGSDPADLLRRTSLNTVDPLGLQTPAPQASSFGLQSIFGALGGAGATTPAVAGIPNPLTTTNPVPPTPTNPSTPGANANPTSPTTIDYTVGGMKLVCASAPTVIVNGTCLNRKQDRAKLPQDVKRSLFYEATKKVLPKFQVLNATKLSDDKDALEEEVSLTQLILATRERHVQFDLQDVFVIVFPTDPLNSSLLSTDGSGVPKTVELYKQFTQVTLQQVAISCYWYNTWVSEVDQPWIRENMTLSYGQLSAHVSVELHNKILETYSRFDHSYRGGPLYFKILMDYLVSSFEHVATSLIKNVKNHKISKVVGEDVTKTVTMLRHACERLRSIDRLPLDISEIILKVYQTSSVPEFNEVFHHLELTQSIYAQDLGTLAAHRMLISDPTVTVQSQDKLLQSCGAWHSLAERKYTQLKYENAWCVPVGNKDPSAHVGDAGDKKTGRVITFKAYMLLKRCCWNCGSTEHELKACPETRNPPQIEANRKAFLEAKEKANGGGGNSSNGGSGGGGKFAPPARGESNKRTIDGKPMYYHFKDKKWRPVTTAALAEGESGTPAATPAPAPASQAPAARTVRISEPVEARLAQCTRQFGDMMSTLRDELGQH